MAAKHKSGGKKRRSEKSLGSPDRRLTSTFISFEGGEGSGKSTQAAILAKHLQAQGHSVIATHEPGGSPAGAVLREVLLAGHAAGQGALAEACILTSARREHVDLVIEPALDRGKTVVCDRYCDSTRIYQGYVGGVPMETIDRLERIATNGIMPDCTLVFDVTSDVANERRRARLAVKDDGDDRFEREDASFHAKVAEGFAWLCDAYPGRCVKIDADGSEAEVANLVLAALHKRNLL